MKKDGVNKSQKEVNDEGKNYRHCGSFIDIGCAGGADTKAREKNHFRSRVCLSLVLLSLFLSAPAGALGSWGLEVGRADAGDVASLVSDWLSFKRGRDRLRIATDAPGMLAQERQRQLLGVEGEDLDVTQLFEMLEDFWLNNLMGPLQSIALNPAASCAEAQFALIQLIDIRRQQQLLGLEEREILTRVYEATEEMASLRCRDEALDECVATGRFRQIIDLMLGTERQMQLQDRKDGDHESWAEDALRQCAIYELHFVSRTKREVIIHHPIAIKPAQIETVRDGRVQIRLKIPDGGLMSARASLAEVLNGKTAGGNNPFFVSVKCQSPVRDIEWICSPGADSKPIEVGINALDLRHREFYIGYEKDKRLPFEFKETEISKERMVGEDKLSFVFEGGEYDIQSLLRHFSGATADFPIDDQKSAFYMAHRKDWTGPGSNILAIEGTKRGVYPTVFQFTYADQSKHPPGILFIDSTEFELIHKPEPKPFQKPPEPIRKPLKPPTG